MTTTATPQPLTRNLLLPAIFLGAAIAPSAHAQAKFIAPTAEELSMTSVPGYPGVAAVILNKEEITKDDLHTATSYARIKILSEDGKKYANVELAYVSSTGELEGFDVGEDVNVEDIQGRTIHPDGTIIPFTGKPYLKTIEKTKGIKVQEKVFTLPDVTVGSIIEYRYATRINDMWYDPPVWIVQDDLYVKSAHFMWYPTSRELQNEHGPINSITWFPILPKSAEIKTAETPGTGAGGLAQRTYELTVNDVPPIPDEDYMPPVRNYSFRVYWNFIAEHNGADFWKDSGHDWSKRVNSFANPNSNLRDATQKIIAGATTQDQKLRAIYAAVMTLENTDYTREREKREDKANGLGKVNNADDVLQHRRGNARQLTELFIGMTRAAGMNADAMIIPSRDTGIFIPQWLNLGQFDAMIAIVNVDGKDMFFDPGERYCSYGHLAWQHTFVKGLRQKGNETVFDEAPSDGYQSNLLTRLANLKMDTNGQITGRIDIAYTGAPALRIRHNALRGDDESLKHELRTSLEDIIPHTLEVKDVTVANVADYENPLKVTYTVEGTVGSWTGKRLVVPADIFFANEKATFPHDKRDIAVDFNYPRQVKDALRIILPSNFAIEATPSTAKFSLLKFAAYGMSVEQSPTYFTTRREYDLGEVFILPQEYAQLRTFYNQFEANDQQSVVLKSTAAPTTTASNSPAAN
jgi:Domain of Unknown Function with PDB structure (DUF3857)/Transglutaminase-like superfamily